MTDPQSGVTTYTYDSLNRLTNLQDPSSHNFGFSYDALSRRTQLTRPNGVNSNYAYDNLSRLLSVLHQVGNTTLDGASYTYDNAGNRTSKTDYLASVTSNYTYDNLYQLTQVTQGSSTTESYSYDAVGNRLSSLGVSPYAYNSSNELTSTPSASYTYDHNGNTTSKTDSSGTTTYNWDTENRLTSVVLPASGGTVSFKYDPWGRRVQKSSASGTINYLYDGPDVIETANNTGTVLATYTKGSGIDETLGVLQDGAISYFEVDGLGATTSLSNSSGSLTDTYTYNSYGQLTNIVGTTLNPFRYTGRKFDAETGLYYFRARYLDPATSRFLNEDPLAFEGGDVDFYRYVNNGPVTYIDPDGLGKLPADPSGLGPQWTRDPSYLDPNGSRWRNPTGDYLDFHRGRPGLPGWRGRDHWHHNGCKEHLAPGTEVPVETVPEPKAETPKAPNNTSGPETQSSNPAGSGGPSQQVQNAVTTTGWLGTLLIIIYGILSQAN